MSPFSNSVNLNIPTISQHVLPHSGAPWGREYEPGVIGRVVRPRRSEDSVVREEAKRCRLGQHSGADSEEEGKRTCEHGESRRHL
jgi:hypothetical protein